MPNGHGTRKHLDKPVTSKSCWRSKSLPHRIRHTETPRDREKLAHPRSPHRGIEAARDGAEDDNAMMVLVAMRW